MYVTKLLNAEELKEIRAQLSKLSWDSGKDTARGSAKDIKQNLQITDARKEALPLLVRVANAIVNNETIRALSFPRKIISPRFAKYEEGGHYDWHVDFPYMHDERTDLSFTLFLNNHTEYEGGELVHNLGASGEKVVKGGAGDIIVYSTGALHKVNPVTSGSRIVVVGWINSFIAHPSIRESLSNLHISHGQLVQLLKNGQWTPEATKAYLDRINESYFNLVRLSIK